MLWRRLSLSADFDWSARFLTSSNDADCNPEPGLMRRRSTWRADMRRIVCCFYGDWFTCRIQGSVRASMILALQATQGHGGLVCWVLQDQTRYALASFASYITPSKVHRVFSSSRSTFYILTKNTPQSNRRRVVVGKISHWRPRIDATKWPHTIDQDHRE